MALRRPAATGPSISLLLHDRKGRDIRKTNDPPGSLRYSRRAYGRSKVLHEIILSQRCLARGSPPLVVEGRGGENPSSPLELDTPHAF